MTVGPQRPAAVTVTQQAPSGPGSSQLGWPAAGGGSAGPARAMTADPDRVSCALECVTVTRLRPPRAESRRVTVTVSSSHKFTAAPARTMSTAEKPFSLVREIKSWTDGELVRPLHGAVSIVRDSNVCLLDRRLISVMTDPDNACRGDCT